MLLTPNISDYYKTSYIRIQIELKLDCNITFIRGNSGSGKTFLWKALNSDSMLDHTLLALSYLTDDVLIRRRLLSAKNRLICIDDADIILQEDLINHIIEDKFNQYIIIGHCEEYYKDVACFKEIKFINNLLTLTDIR
jgi:chromosomal replication initiation ATPase DnaA